MGLRRQGGYWLSTRGTMQFDIADMEYMERTDSFLSVVEHEMAHVMGFGTLWSANRVYQSGSGRYTGTNAIAAARVELGKPDLAFIPVELGGGQGTANSHWDERDGGVCCTGYVDGFGRDATYELMTGWLNAPTFISQTTIQSFVDIGYMAGVAGTAGMAAVVGMASFVGAISEPDTYLMLLAGLCMLGVALRRAKHSIVHG